ITQLKIDHNPFAKGFRDSGGGKRDKKRTTVGSACSRDYNEGNSREARTIADDKQRATDRSQKREVSRDRAERKSYNQSHSKSPQVKSITAEVTCSSELIKKDFLGKKSLSESDQWPYKVPAAYSENSEFWDSSTRASRKRRHSEQSDVGHESDNEGVHASSSLRPASPDSSTSRRLLVTQTKSSSLASCVTSTSASKASPRKASSPTSKSAISFPVSAMLNSPTDVSSMSSMAAPLSNSLPLSSHRTTHALSSHQFQDLKSSPSQLELAQHLLKNANSWNPLDTFQETQALLAAHLSLLSVQFLKHSMGVHFANPYESFPPMSQFASLLQHNQLSQYLGNNHYRQKHQYHECNSPNTNNGSRHASPCPSEKLSEVSAEDLPNPPNFEPVQVQSLDVSSQSGSRSSSRSSTATP
ncbi:T-box transcription factor TBX2, partial [Biomphalaria glabrata]